MSARGKILVIRGGAIGDFILTLPVLSALREHYPGAPVEVLGYRHILALAQAGELACAVHSIEARALAGFFVRDGELNPDLVRFFSDFAVIISYLYDPDQVFEENVKRCSGAQFLTGAHQPDQFPGQHATETLLQPLERLAIFDSDPVPRLALPGAVRESAGTLALHPGSGSERKNWPDYKWRDLCPRLEQAHAGPILLVGGEAERERVTALARLLPQGRTEVALDLPLPDLARRLAGCGAFLGHDSGITHLAAAVGVPCLVLWGETNETVWRPLGQRVLIMQHPSGLRAITVDAVLDTLPELGKTGEPSV